MIRLLQAHAACNNTTRKKKRLFVKFQIHCLLFPSFSFSLLLFDISSFFWLASQDKEREWKICMVQLIEVTVGGKTASCCGQSCFFVLLLLVFMKTDCGLLLIRFPRGLPSSKRHNKLGKLWNKVGRRNSRTGRTYVVFS